MNDMTPVSQAADLLMAKITDSYTKRRHTLGSVDVVNPARLFRSRIIRLFRRSLTDQLTRPDLKSIMSAAGYEWDEQALLSMVASGTIVRSTGDQGDEEFFTLSQDMRL